jgi:homoserine dehydrogenase
MKDVKLGLIGLGTVGAGVARLLIEKQKLIAARLGMNLVLNRVADLDQETDRGISFPEGVFIQDAWQIVNDPDIDIVIETIGGDTIAKEIILAAIEQGKHVVTANKALLAMAGNEIQRAADAKGIDLGYEASVCGCMPVIKSIREALVANEIRSMTGILNGTCNYILSQMSDSGTAFEAALVQAQNNGYAEADPTLDIEGLDAAHKLSILMAIAYGMPINFSDIFTAGISHITPLDIKWAAEFGYRIKLLAISKFRKNSVEARVHPTMIPNDNILSNVTGSLNAITINGHAVGDLFLSGYGAGMMPTASAVLSDIVDLARNIRFGAAGRVPLTAYQTSQINPIPVLPVTEIITHYYFRFAALDRPGVLSAIAGILGKFGISIKTVQQKGRKTNGTVPIVMLTHYAKEADIQSAVKEIAALDVVGAAPTVIRIEDEDQEV